MSSDRTDNAGRFAYEGLHRTLHERARLSIMTSLMSNPEGLLFNDLKELCNLSDGNLSRHLSVLEEADLISHEKRNPSGSQRAQTMYRITETGQAEYLSYLDELEQLIEDAHSSAEDVKTSDEDSDGTEPTFSPAT